MLRNSNKFLFMWVMLLLSITTMGQEHLGDLNGGEAVTAVAEEEGAKHGDLSEELSIKDQIKENINHHLLDSYYFDVSHDEEADVYYGFSLPVILIDNGLKVFMSSEFDHGKKVVTKGDSNYKLYHNKIYKTDAAGTINYDEHHHPSNEKPLNFSITKNVFVIFIASVILFLIFTSVAKTYKKSMLPKGFGRLMEPLILYVRDEIAIPSIGKKHYKRYMGFLLTIFFFIWFVNILGLTPLGINVTGNISVTIALALFTFVITNVSGNKTYWGHVFDPLGNSMPWVGKILIYIILVPIEILSIFVKPFSLFIRLFANISAGHIVMMSLIGLIFVFKNMAGGSMSFLLAVAISFIEFFVALLQAYIFTMLSALYFGLAVEEHDEH